MNVTVVGAGYVGLVTGAGLAEVGNHVICIDVDSKKVDLLQQGYIPIHEPGLATIVQKNVAASRLRFTTSIAVGVEHCAVLFIAVGTPPDEDSSADLKYVLQVAASIGENIQKYCVVATKSTVPVGTSVKVQQTIKQELSKRGVSIPFSVVSNPEFLKEGAAVEDFMKPDRIIIGTDDIQAVELMRTLYAPFNRNHNRLITMDLASAELTKYAANAMLATKISFMNEMAILAEKLGADIESVRHGIGADPRIGYEHIYPGCGYGGSCLPKDIKALRKMAEEVGYNVRVVNAVEAVNTEQKKCLVKKLFSHFGDNLKGKKFALWGLAFKPNTDDMREAPSRIVMELLWQAGAQISAFDPEACSEVKRIYGERSDLKLNNKDPYAVLNDASALIIVTEWKVFRTCDLDLIKSRLTDGVVVDGRNILDPVAVRESGLIYYGIGR